MCDVQRHRDRVHHRFEFPRPRPFPRFGLPQRLLRRPSLAPHRRFADFPLDGRSQPRQVVLHHVIVRAQFHHLDRQVLAQRRRYHDEGDIQPRLLHNAQCRRSIETGQMVIRYHDVPRPRLESGVQPGGVVHALGLHFMSGLFQKPDDHCRVALGIFNIQNS